MTGKYLIPKTQNDSRQPLAVSGLKRSHQARRNRRARPQLELLEERCLLSFGSPTTTTLTLDKFNITYGGTISATPVVSSTDAPGGIPLTGFCQLEVDDNPYGVPQAVGTTFVVTDLPAGWHTLEASYSGDSDYQGSTTSSTSTIYVAAAELTVTADDYSRAYGAADPAFTYSITGFVNGDSYEQSEVQNPTAPQIKPTDTGSSSWVGNYTINISQPDSESPQLSYLDANYVIDQTFNPGILTITPAALTITASNQSKTYGFDAAHPGSSLALDPTYTYSGQLFNGDLIQTMTLSTNATLSSTSHYNAGTWTITPSAAIFLPGLSSNYAITYANAATGLTVVPQALGITGESAQSSKMYDGTTVDPINPTATLSGTVLSFDKVFLVSGRAAPTSPTPMSAPTRR